MAAPIEARNGSPETGTLKPLYDTHLSIWMFSGFGVSADGQRFLWALPDEGSAKSTLSQVLNWPGRSENNNSAAAGLVRRTSK